MTYPVRPGGWCNSMISTGWPPSTARGKSRHGIRPSLHPGGLRCDSVTYSRYAPSSRLVRRAQERSRCSRDFHHGLSSLNAISSHAAASVKWVSRTPAGLRTCPGRQSVGRLSLNSVTRACLRLARTASSRLIPLSRGAIGFSVPVNPDQLLSYGFSLSNSSHLDDHMVD